MNDWLEVTVETTDAQMEGLAARLTMNGAEGLVLENETDFRAFLEQNRQYWDYVDDALLERMRGVARIKFYVTDDEAGKALMTQALRGIESPVSTALLKEEDWAYSWQKYYQPMTVGETLYIVPEWERGKPIPDGRTAVYLNPGGARPGGPGALLSEPRSHLRHRLPRLHPALSHPPGEKPHPRIRLAGPGLRQRHFVHRRPEPGVFPGHRGGY